MVPRRMFRLAVLLLLLSAQAPLAGQQRITWRTLSAVMYSYIQPYNQAMWYGKPTFSPEIRQLDGKEIIISGYILPVSTGSNLYYLSANPFSSCFFCGGAGQESVMELRLKNPKEKYQMDQYVTMKGVLRLNDRELEVNYILDYAQRTD
ncbi:MAG: DUF3299 domain-containing protein [Bacteroidia bacterium]|nr:DUF3299 domain-containing protein [Bacteroidia bacterium]